MPDPDYESKRKWRLQNPEKARASSREYYQRNRDKVLKRNKEYNRLYRATNRERIVAQSREYEFANQEKRKEWRHIRYLQNREAEGQKQRQYVNKLRIQACDVLAKAYNFSVPKCMMSLTPYLPTADEPCKGPLEFDHIHPQGKRTVLRNAKLLRAIRDGRIEPSEVRLLCEHHNRWHYRIDLVFEKLRDVHEKEAQR